MIDLRLADLIDPDFSLATTDSSQTPAPEILPEISREKISAEAPYSENNTADKAFDGDLINLGK
ncbi:MAG: hypothetical protein MR430_05230 [Lachnospiraceae bacterium]|nr:hypothetical protein [Lachnospiraceae bacterium]